MSGSSTATKNTSQSGTSASNTSSSNTENQSSLTNQNVTGANTQNSTTWAPQAAALLEAFQQAQNVYGKQSQAVAPNNFVAGLTPEQIATYQKMVSAGGNTSVADAQASTGGALANTGTSGLQGALSGLNGYDASASNNPDTLVAAANKYVAGQDIDAQVRNAMLNATQTARDVTLPGIEQNAATSGNINSSRTGIAQGLVERGLAQQSADLGASLRSNAFKDGLNLAQTQAATNNAAKLAALSTGGALSNNAASTGLAGLGSSVGSLTSLLGLAGAGGAGLQSGDQDMLTNELQKYQAAQNAGSTPLDNLMRIIGAQQWGTSTSGTTSGTTTGSNTQTGSSTGSSNMFGTSNSVGTEETSKNPSAWEIIGGLLGAAGNAKKAFF